MDELEVARMELEKIKVAAARAEMEFNIKQRRAEIKRLEENIKNQLTREAELSAKIEEATKGA